MRKISLFSFRFNCLRHQRLINIIILVLYSYFWPSDRQNDATISRRLRQGRNLIRKERKIIQFLSRRLASRVSRIILLECRSSACCISAVSASWVPCLLSFILIEFDFTLDSINGTISSAAKFSHFLVLKMLNMPMIKTWPRLLSNHILHLSWCQLLCGP